MFSAKLAIGFDHISFVPAILLNWPQISNLKRQDWGRLSCIFIFIFIYISWWYSAQRSLGFIAGSPVSYGPLPEYKASPGKNYNKINQTRHRKLLFENSNLLQICEHLVQFEVFPLEPRAFTLLQFQTPQLLSAVSCRHKPPNINKYLFTNINQYMFSNIKKPQISTNISLQTSTNICFQISTNPKYQQIYLFYLSYIWDKMNTSQSTQ